MKYFKSLFSKFHLAIAVFTGVNILLGLSLRFAVPLFSMVALWHLYAGLLLFLVPLLLFALMKERNLAWKAFTARLFIHKKDFQNKILLCAKITAWLFLLSLIFSAILAVMVKSGLGALAFPDTNLLLLHTKGIYIVVPLLVLHGITMLAAYHKKPKKFDKA